MADVIASFFHALAADHAWATKTLMCATAARPELVYRRIWPSTQVLEVLDELEADPVLAWNGCLDSALDLRDGLSVVEVFSPVEAPVVLASLAAPQP